ncbi:MAG: hypothetical protein KGH64_04635 [Candidatus Micrarchaeota archaeon]|nr:hypothetical protein [Candidatus Micrarchaeota archaeon]MDE1834599.1 hypothetical protein [Candidatus Micrarchaeota archaeon]MDE1859202.1 hypothetical protein [Candidatus Micrarchaeota archaeon]
MNQELLQKQKIIVVDFLSRGNFTEMIGSLTKNETDVLRLLILHHEAIAIRTIRNFIVFNLGMKNKSTLLKANKISILEMPEGGIKEKTRYLANLANTISDPKKLKVLLVFAPDSTLISQGIPPMSLTEKIDTLESVLKDSGVSVPSWDAIKNAVDNLVYLTLIQRKQSKKSEWAYEVSPVVYKLWREELERVSGRSNRTDAELRSFLFSF